ncbi:GNAT family N-acetyltransferase [Bacillus cytotoxicus]|uniref:GCN5-related N-acetyltransferase n=2 Tax=Bacillus cytotoxicus TaxID=580165 RepID=A0AAX2CLF4_9BACI|nr:MULTISPECIES: GNAT family protein [Bacillus cereus group]ABS23563.1 GCN5-related N-acetyltransferase [Bacillus cytotoxicus NVH 391-98]MDH2864624.1 GNAT family N-acetyltransferase [Bacillus cytotoxicus]MDH2883747.1 GNAT family N-acetyltransferase [Bacillus cytotoxicus]MDH2887952.1 GNAT family N-acetyltransferase [Bacillus cytotoxicus]NZD33243.1 GNAT family N-acetyltransferase [Bacillus cytotoxicus]
MFTLRVDDEIELQLLEKHHKEELYQLINQNRNHLRRWLPWVDGTKSADAYDDIFPRWLKKFAEGGGFESGIRYKGKLVGMVSIHPVSWEKKAASLGYYLAEEAEGKGIITRSVKAVLRYGFEDLKLNKMEIHCGVQNKKNRAVPERLGFRLDGILREEEWLYDHFHDIAVYSLLASEWKKIR